LKINPLPNGAKNGENWFTFDKVITDTDYVMSCFLWTTLCSNCSLNFEVYNTEMFGVQIIVTVDKI